MGSNYFVSSEISAMCEDQQLFIQISSSSTAKSCSVCSQSNNVIMFERKGSIIFLSDDMEAEYIK